MKTNFKILLVFLLVLVTFGQHTPAFAAYQEDNQGQWITAEASFESFDPSGCIYTQVYVFAVKALSSVDMEIYQYDVCTGTTLLYAWNPYSKLEESDFLVTDNLSMATLNATIPVNDWERNISFDVSVNLTWTGISKLSHYTSNFHFHGSGCHEVSNSHRRWRYAQVTGTVLNGATNLTPGPAVYGAIYSPKSVYIYGCREAMMTAISPEIASAIKAGHQNYDLSGSYASFSSVDETECIYTDSFVAAGDLTLGTGKNSSDASFMSVSIYQFDVCAYTSLLSAHSYSVPLEETDFVITGNRASLNKQVTIYDPDRELSFDTLVELTWKTSGPLNQGTYTLNLHDAGCLTHGHEKWGWRPGNATGMISSAEADFAPLPSVYAELNWDHYVVELCK